MNDEFVLLFNLYRGGDGSYYDIGEIGERQLVVSIGDEVRFRTSFLMRFIAGSHEVRIVFDGCLGGSHGSRRLVRGRGRRHPQGRARALRDRRFGKKGPRRRVPRHGRRISRFGRRHRGAGEMPGGRHRGDVLVRRRPDRAPGGFGLQRGGSAQAEAGQAPQGGKQERLRRRGEGGAHGDRRRRATRSAIR